MTIAEQIDHDLKEAMRAKQAERLGVIRMLKSALKNAALEKGGAEARLDDAEALAVLRKQAKQRQDAIDGFRQGGREDLVAKEESELTVLRGYLPQALAPAELEALVAEAIRETGATSKAQMGAVMKWLQAKAAGRVDGRTLSQEVQKRLA